MAAPTPTNYRTNSDPKDLGHLPPRRSALTRTRTSVEYGLGICLAPQTNQFFQTRLDGSIWEMPPGNALRTTVARHATHLPALDYGAYVDCR
jgi:hypothetical protein